MRQGRAMMRFQAMSKKLAFFNTELIEVSDDVLLKASALYKDHSVYLK
jgi:hypothetical protein